jgi:glycerol uptake facilitator-like aquaporin
MNDAEASLGARLLAEAVGTAGLVAVVVGSGIMAERLAGDAALVLLANSLATGAGLFALCATFGPVSGAHFNPAVTLGAWAARDLPAQVAVLFIAVQFLAAPFGVLAVHAMFDEPLWQVATKARGGAALVGSEVLATAGLLLAVRGLQSQPSPHGPAVVALYITSAYWFTASTAFANPAVTLARALTDSYTGIRPDDLPGFWIAQLVAVAAVGVLAPMLWPRVQRKT